MRKKEIMPYVEELFRLLKEKFKNDISYRYKILILKNEECNKYSVCLAIDINNNGQKNTIAFYPYKKFMKLDKEKHFELIGNFYNADIIGKDENEFGIEDAQKDFLKLCDFNYLKEEVLDNEK